MVGKKVVYILPVGDYMGVSKNRGTPKMDGQKKMENPIKMG